MVFRQSLVLRTPSDVWKAYSQLQTYNDEISDLLMVAYSQPQLRSISRGASSTMRYAP